MTLLISISSFARGERSERVRWHGVVVGRRRCQMKKYATSKGEEFQNELSFHFIGMGRSPLAPRIALEVPARRWSGVFSWP
ncbi:hypothetical protein TNCV_257321 [Trichonephila clavipes]|nr:hypothetical protein TNCV_257321 [Trichonephila clavipes]